MQTLQCSWENALFFDSARYGAYTRVVKWDFLYSEVPSSFLVNTVQTLSKSVYNCQSYWVIDKSLGARFYGALCTSDHNFATGLFSGCQCLVFFFIISCTETPLKAIVWYPICSGFTNSVSSHCLVETHNSIVHHLSATVTRSVQYHLLPETFSWGRVCTVKPALLLARWHSRDVRISKNRCSSPELSYTSILIALL